MTLPAVLAECRAAARLLLVGARPCSNQSTISRPPANPQQRRVAAE